MVQVDHPSSEFFVPLLRHGVHFYTLAGGREPVREKLLPLLRSLHASPSQPAAVAAAARAFALHWLSFEGVLSYLRILLHTYAAAYERGRRATASPPLNATDAAAAGYVRVDDENDLQALAGLCAPKDRTCALVRPQGGRSAGRAAREIAREMHSKCTTERVHRRWQKTLPPCTLWAPRGGSRCFDTRCCTGWDCGTWPLGCA